MFINNKLSCFQQQRIQKYSKKTDSYKFFNLLTSPKLLDTVEELLPAHRERLYPPTETLSMFLAQALSEDRLGARKRVTDFRKGKRLGTKDYLVELFKPKKKPDWMTQEYYESVPDTLVIRELKVKGKIVITTLLSSKNSSKPELEALYKKRWQIEVDFRNIKTTMGMETLSCKTPEMNEKEIWIYFLA